MYMAKQFIVNKLGTKDKANIFPDEHGFTSAHLKKVVEAMGLNYKENGKLVVYK